MVRVLVTGFEPFDKSAYNPSQAIAEGLRGLDLPGVELRCQVLPVEFQRASAALCEVIDAWSPKVVIAFGQAEGRGQITPERVAVNLIDARIPDNAGFRPQEQAIATDGPAAYFSTLPVREMVRALQEEGIGASVSMTAGTFVCNDLFYAMQHHCRGLDIRSGFVHVPLMDEQAEEFPGLPTLSIEVLTRAATRAIEVCLQ